MAKIISYGFIGPSLTPDQCMEGDWSESNLPNADFSGVEDYLPDSYMRLSSFMNKAVIGANICLRRADIEKDGKRIGIFLGSGLANYSGILPFFQSLFVEDRGHFSPARFVNSVGNASTFYLGQASGLEGVHYTLSQEELSFEAALFHADIALSQGDVDLALVGGCDSYDDTRNSMIERLDLQTVDRPLGEGSSWILLEDAPRQSIATVSVTFNEARPEVLLSQLKECTSTSCYLLPGYRVEKDLLPAGDDAQAIELLDYTNRCGIHQTASAFGICQALQTFEESNFSGSAVHVQTTLAGQMGTIVLDTSS